MSETYTFRSKANGPVIFTVEAATVSDAFMAANAAVVGDLPGFYAWFGNGPDFSAGFGVWD